MQETSDTTISLDEIVIEWNVFFSLPKFLSKIFVVCLSLVHILQEQPTQYHVSV